MESGLEENYKYFIIKISLLAMFNYPNIEKGFLKNILAFSGCWNIFIVEKKKWKYLIDKKNSKYKIEKKRLDQIENKIIYK